MPKLARNTSITRKIESVRSEIDRFRLIPPDGMTYHVVAKEDSLEDMVSVVSVSGAAKVLAWGTLVSVFAHSESTAKGRGGPK